jgi:hypothetical protein
MRHVGWLTAIAIAFLAIQSGILTTKRAEPSVFAMDIMEFQMRANKDMPFMVIADPI